MGKHAVVLSNRTLMNLFQDDAVTWLSTL
ncbi:site-specific DNA-methyltransferase, partial [Vibrio anguillarum]|nr:site-specific DNA-methyltransferase [Vibrio anguillarum]